MKGSSETKLLLILGLIVLLGGGAMFGLNKLQEQPAEKPRPTPTPFAWNEATFGELTKGATHVNEKPGAQITVVEFADFECPACRRAYDLVLRKMEHEKPVRFIFRHLPFGDMHPNAMPAAMAVEAAAKQGKFWEMYDALFDGVKTEIPESYITKLARKINLDMTRFEKDRNDPASQKLIESDKEMAGRFGVVSTPTFIIRDAKGTFTQVTGGKDLKDVLEKNGIKF
jgi:protein-disulfide isomerase